MEDSKPSTSRTDNELSDILPRADQTSFLEDSLMKRKKQKGHTPSLPKRDLSRPLLLSHSQEQFWYLEHLFPNTGAYNMSEFKRISGPLDIPALEYALSVIVERHETLRTTFVQEGRDPIQVIHDSQPVVLDPVDLSKLPHEARVAEMNAIISRETLFNFDLTTGPLFRFHLIRLTSDEHVFGVNVHRIIGDDISMGIFSNELEQLYSAYLRGESLSLPELTLHYADFAQWERDQPGTKIYEESFGYWKEKFKDLPEALNLPTDYSRSQRPSFEGDSVKIEMSESLCQAVFDISIRENVSVHTVLLSVFSVLLYRYTGQRNLTIGTPAANRSLSETESMMGCFENVVLLRTLKDPSASFCDLLRQVCQETVNGLSHQSFHLEKLVEHLNPSRSTDFNPLFQVFFSYKNQPELFAIDLPSVEITHLPPSDSISVFDLTLLAVHEGDTLNLTIEYPTNLFKRKTIERMGVHFRQLLQAAIARPEDKIAELPILGSSERAQILNDWNTTDFEYDKTVCLHQLFEEQVTKTPASIAAIFGEVEISYRELDKRANRLANHLQMLGAQSDALIGICLERSLEMLVALLGVLKSGAAYVPLDPAYPADRIAYVLSDAKSPILVTQQSLLDSLDEMPAKVVCIDRDSQSIEKSSSTRPEPSSGSHNLAYVIYTSGSTGRPKGVQIEHQAVVNFLESMGKEPGLNQRDILLAVTTLSFDIAVLELYLPLLKGAKVVVAPRETAIDAEAIQRAIEKYNITIMQATPATWRMLIQNGWQGSKNLKILCGGEAMPSDLAEKLLFRCSELWNMYGPTETTVWSTCCRVESFEDIHIGRPIGNTQLYILDQTLQPTPIGVPGELMIGGDGLARGYFQRLELTEEKFIPNPFRKGEKIYRTGDLAKYRPDGIVECLGRVDFQVKIRGFRIELEEIETVLSQQSGIKQAVVIAREDIPGDKRLVAYVQADTSSKLNPDELRGALRSKLPEYMVPATLVTMDTLPLTPNGKVDRKALPEPEQTETRIPDGDFHPPQGEKEKKLADIMQSLLRVSQVGRNDNFFDLGGHSIIAVSLFNKIEQIFGKRLQLATLFRSGTVKLLAIELEKDDERLEEWSSLVPIQPQGSKSRFFCVHGAGGNVLFYRILSQKMGDNYPFYGLQSQGQDTKTQPLTTIEEMARKYVEEIKSIQPTGPYHLGGYCLGGTIAYEMAQILRKEGQEVALLALLDTYNFSLMKERNLVSFLLQKTWFHIGNFIKVPFSMWPSYLSSKIQVGKDGEFSLLFGNMTNVFKKKSRVKSIHDSIHQINHMAAMKYKPRPYDGVIVNFRPKRNYSFYTDKNMGWKDLARGEFIDVKFNFNPHAMLVEPFVEELAKALVAKLD